MASIQLPDNVFAIAKRKALEQGYLEVEHYISDLIIYGREAADSDFGAEKSDHLFTPELLAEIEKAEAEIDAGNCLSADEVDQYFEKKRTDRLQKEDDR